MNNLTQSDYKNELIPSKINICGVCGTNGGSKKVWYYFNSNRRGKICRFCEHKFDSPTEVSDYLKEHAVFSKTGELLGFKPSEAKQK